MNNDWTNFCGWLKEYIGVDIPITWERYEHQDGNIVRIDIFKGRPFHITTAVPDERHLNDMDIAYELARGLEWVLRKAIRNGYHMRIMLGQGAGGEALSGVYSKAQAEARPRRLRTNLTQR